MATKLTRRKDFYKLKGRYDEKDGKWYYGRVRMIFINKFTHCKDKNIDYDFQLDAEVIKSTFENLQFKVDEVILDPTKDELINCLKEKIDYYGCVVMFVFSHGEQDSIWCSDYNEKDESGKINVWVDLYKYFSEEEKPELKECPKVFFHEWCQNFGNRESVAIDIHSCNDTDHSLIFNAAQPGRDAITDPEEGSIFTQCYCKYLIQNAQKYDLQTIFEYVKSIVTKKLPFVKPICSTTLTKKLYLLPEDEVHKNNSQFKRNFENCRVLGYGAFGVVFKAQSIETKTEYAIKRIQLKNADFDDRAECEKFKLNKLSNKCKKVVGFNHVWYEYADFEYQFKQDCQLDIQNLLTKTGSIIKFCYIQMELCGVNLEKWLKQNSNRDKKVSLNIFKQIIQGLAFIHKNNIAHLDINPSNILFALTDELRIRIADFGLAKYVNKSACKISMVNSIYMAPEIKEKRFSTKSDMYSAGLILIELLHNCSDKNEKILKDAINGLFPEPFQNELKFAVPILENLLSSNLNDRFSSDELLRILSTNSDWNEELAAIRKEEENLKIINLKTKELQLIPSIPDNKELVPIEQEEEELIRTEESEFISSIPDIEELATIGQEEKELRKTNDLDESTCTIKEHNIEEKSLRNLTKTLCWNTKNSCTEWETVETAASKTTSKCTKWKIRFRNSSKFFGVFILCHALNVKFSAVSVRCYVYFKNYPQVWTEGAAVLKFREQFSSEFSDNLLSQFSRSRSVKELVIVSLQWSEVKKRQFKPDLWHNCTARVQYRWKLHGWKTVTPTAVHWRLFSKPFGRCGALWRIVVENKANIRNKRELRVELKLQHLPASVNWSRLSMNCSLCLWDQQYDVQMKNMKEDEYCWWRVVKNVELESRDPLDLIGTICASRKS